MSIFYNREENEKEIKIVFKSLALRMYLVFGILILMLYLSTLSDTNVFLQLIFIPLLILILSFTIIVFTIAYWKPSSEIRKAMKKSQVQVSGNRWSFKNPHTVVLPKQ